MMALSVAIWRIARAVCARSVVAAYLHRLPLDAIQFADDLRLVALELARDTAEAHPELDPVD